MRRPNNQDCLVVRRASSPEHWRARGHIFMVADGMGGHAAGDIASTMACDYIPRLYRQMISLSPAEALLKAYRKVDGMIHNHAGSDPACRGMGTTCSTLVLLPEGALIAHVGDSRVYRIRRSKIEQLSSDHSMAWELIRAGLVSPAKAKNTIVQNVITRSLGLDANVEVDIEGPLPLETGDVFLLCSDGLSGHVEDPEMGLFGSLFDPEDAARCLIALANLRGGRDNITVVLARVGPLAAPTNAPDISGGMTAAEFGHPADERIIKTSLAARKRPVPVQEHIYRTASVAITEELVTSLSDQMRMSREIARSQAWSVDWPSLEAHSRRAEDAFAEGKLQNSARAVGEALVLLGTACRLHKETPSVS